ncbi:MAG: AAA family ATPase, partial [Bacteroidota bacterium]
MNANEVTALLFKEFPYDPTPGQRVLIEKLGNFLFYSWNTPGSVFILKGYAGTGKTTIVTALVNVLPRLKKRSVLLAPTGRAAKVLANYSKRPANTIHRKIYFARTTKEGNIALKLQSNLHKDTLFIVDEASMIQNSNMNDFGLFAGANVLEDLFTYVFSGENNGLIFIGDTAQLPPVGLDKSPALDLDYLRTAFHIDLESFELTEVVRQSQGSGILTNATAIREEILRERAVTPIFNLENFDGLNTEKLEAVSQIIERNFDAIGLQEVSPIAAEKLKEKGWFDGLFATLEWHVEFYPDKKGGCQHSAMLHFHMFGNRSEPLTFEQGKEIQDLYTKICCRSNSALPAYPDLEIAPIISQARLKSWINYQIKTIPVERFYKEGLRNGCSVAALNAEFQQTAWELPNLVRSPRKYGNLYVSKPGYIGEQQFKKVTKSQYERL